MPYVRMPSGDDWLAINDNRRALTALKTDTWVPKDSSYLRRVGPYSWTALDGRKTWDFSGYPRRNRDTFSEAINGTMGYPTLDHPRGRYFNAYPGYPGIGHGSLGSRGDRMLDAVDRADAMLQLQERQHLDFMQERLLRHKLMQLEDNALDFRRKQLHQELLNAHPRPYPPPAFMNDGPDLLGASRVPRLTAGTPATLARPPAPLQLTSGQFASVPWTAGQQFSGTNNLTDSFSMDPASRLTNLDSLNNSIQNSRALDPPAASLGRSFTDNRNRSYTTGTPFDGAPFEGGMADSWQ